MSTSLRRSQPVRSFGPRPAGTSPYESAIVITLSTVIFMMITLAIAHFFRDLPDPARQFAHTVPNVIGVDLATVEDRAASSEFSVRVLGQRPSEQYPRGVISSSHRSRAGTWARSAWCASQLVKVLSLPM